MLFSYKAKSKTGEIIEGVLDASDRITMAHELRLRGQTPISVSEKGENLSDQISKILNIFPE